MKTLFKPLLLVLLCAFGSNELLAQTINIFTQNNTACSSPNGWVSANVDGQIQGYSFEWRQGTLPTGPVLTTGAVVTTLGAGYYTVVVTADATGEPVGSMTGQILDAIETPQIFLQVSHTTCTTPNGSITAVVSGSLTDHTFQWYAGIGVSPMPPLSTNQTLNGLSPGTYTVMVTNTLTGCANLNYTTVLDQVVAENISVQVLSNLTSCTSPNGSLKAIVPAGGGYIYEWYKGAVASGSIVSASQTYSQLVAGVYTVKVTKASTGCQTIISATVVDQTVKPVVSITTLSPVTSCTSPNGSLRAIVSGSLSNYTFKWYIGANTSGPNFSSSPTVSNLAAGTYTISVMHKVTRCVTVVTATLLPVVSVQTTSDTSCAGPYTGSLTAVVQGSASGYIFQWFFGTGLNGPPFATGQTVTGVPAGTYTLLATNNTGTCQLQVSAIVADEQAAPVVSVLTSDVTSCVPANGSLTAVVDGSASDYTFDWYAGMDVSGPSIGSGETISELGAGNYTVMVTNVNTGCLTILSATVNDLTLQPSIFLNAVNNTSCTVPNGMATAIWFEFSPVYAFAWYQGTVNAGPVIGTGQTIVGLPGGFYTVVVTGVNTGCEAILTTMIFDMPVSPMVSVNVVSANTSCTVPNGELEAVVNGPLGQYMFEWFEGAFVYASPVISNSATVQNLNGGVYTVVVTDISSGCQTLFSAVVLNECMEFLNTSLATEASAISYYPNPTTGTLWVTSAAQAGYIVVRDKEGREVYRENASPSGALRSVDLSDQPSGNYVLTFTSALGSSQYHIVKE